MPDLPLAEIQGFVLRTYAMPALRVIALRVEQRAAAGRFIAGIAGAEPALLQVTPATQWTTKPDVCLNVGFTHAGLVALGLPAASAQTLPEEFIEGAAARAAKVGDTGDSAPEQWIGGYAAPDLHVLLFVFAQTEVALLSACARLRSASVDSGAFSELSVHDGRSLPNNVAHFGYRDGFSQPSIDGGLPAPLPDVLPASPAGAFLLGYPSQWEDFSYPVPQPDAFGRNGTFLAFRILSQDCAAFERFLTDAAAQAGVDRELIAAKLCGRWRNGVPLALSPDAPDATLPLERYNSFDYKPSAVLPDAFNDSRGMRCPIGAHVRRMNPRNSVVAGNGGLKRRIVRRGLPYGPPFDPNNPDDGIDRGLLGLFIGASLKDQFEFLMADWANKGLFAPGLRGTRDPILGANGGDARFILPTAQGTIELSGLSRFVTTRAGAYCFLPSLTSLRYIANVTTAV
jgi:Dyp-type peroxidase family